MIPVLPRRKSPADSVWLSQPVCTALQDAYSVMSFTVMGDAVNLASRPESANKFYGTRCMVSQATIAAAAQAVEAREIRPMISNTICGRVCPAAAAPSSGRASAEQIALRAHYSEGLAAYRARRWDEAMSALNAALPAPCDGPCMVLLTRVESLRDNPPSADWDGHGASIRKTRRADLPTSIERQTASEAYNSSLSESGSAWPR